MEIIKFVNYLSDHLKDKIILEISPKYIHIVKNYYPLFKISKISKISELIEEKYDQKWYFESKLLQKESSIELDEKSLEKSLKLEYYDLFDRLFQDFKEKYAVSKSLLDNLLKVAAFNGNLEYFNLMLNLGANDYNGAIMRAAGEGQIEIIRRILDLTKSNNMLDYHDPAMRIAAQGGHIEIIRLILDEMKSEKIKPDYQGVMWEAAQVGQIEIMKWMLDLMKRDGIKPDYKYAMIQAARGGQLEIMKWLLNLRKSKRLKPNYDDVMIEAISTGGQFEMVKLLLDEMESKGIKPHYDSGINFARLQNQKEIIDLLQSRKKLHPRT